MFADWHAHEQSTRTSPRRLHFGAVRTVRANGAHDEMCVMRTVRADRVRGSILATLEWKPEKQMSKGGGVGFGGTITGNHLRWVLGMGEGGRGGM